MNTPKNYLNNFPDSLKILEYKYLLFDSNVLINLLDDFNTEILDILQEHNVTFSIIHPVYVELLNTNNATKRAERQQALSTYKFNILPLNKLEFDYARETQVWLSLKQCFPEPTDLYLAGTIARYSPNLFLVTSNLKHFPYPLFNRKCYAIIQNVNQAQIINFIKINKKILSEGQVMK